MEGSLERMILVVDVNIIDFEKKSVREERNRKINKKFKLKLQNRNRLKQLKQPKQPNKEDSKKIIISLTTHTHHYYNDNPHGF